MSLLTAMATESWHLEVSVRLCKVLTLTHARTHTHAHAHAHAHAHTYTMQYNIKMQTSKLIVDVLGDMRTCFIGSIL